jgi:hypothetical protein
VLPHVVEDLIPEVLPGMHGHPGQVDGEMPIGTVALVNVRMPYFGCSVAACQSTKGLSMALVCDSGQERGDDGLTRRYLVEEDK